MPGTHSQAAPQDGIQSGGIAAVCIPAEKLANTAQTTTGGTLARSSQPNQHMPKQAQHAQRAPAQQLAASWAHSMHDTGKTSSQWTKRYKKEYSIRRRRGGRAGARRVMLLLLPTPPALRSHQPLPWRRQGYATLPIQLALRSPQAPHICFTWCRAELALQGRDAVALRNPAPQSYVLLAPI